MECYVYLGEEVNMARVAKEVNLTHEERQELKKMVRKRKIPAQLRDRANIILYAAEGLTNQEISKRVGMNENRVGKWRKRFIKLRLDGLKDAPRRGHPLIYDSDIRLKVITTVCSPPENTTHWSIRELQRALARKYGINMSFLTVYRILKSADLKPHQYKMWLNSKDPEFEKRQAEIVGLYLDPPENALVISVDEKTTIQVLDRPLPSKPIKPGLPEKIEAHYIRRGTKSLIAGLIVHEGTILGECYERHSHKEFLEFLKRIDKTYPTGEIHIIADNLSVHKHEKVQAFLKVKNGRIQFHFTPTHASWLNQIELWFSILARKVLKRGIFKSKEELVDKIMNFIKEYNKEAKPFRWTYTGEPLRI